MSLLPCLVVPHHQAVLLQHLALCRVSAKLLSCCREGTISATSHTSLSSSLCHPAPAAPSALSALAAHFSSHHSKSGNAKWTYAFNQNFASFKLFYKIIGGDLGLSVMNLGTAAAQSTHVRTKTLVLCAHRVTFCFCPYWTRTPQSTSASHDPKG